MAKTKTRPYPPALLELMASKTGILMKARTFADMGMQETAQPMWVAAAVYEERIAPRLDALGRSATGRCMGMEGPSSRRLSRANEDVPFCRPLFVALRPTRTSDV